MSARRVLGALAMAASVVTVLLPAQAGAQQPDTFPHARHQGLFPLCTGCHGGVPANDQARFYPSPATCNGCHNGVEVRQVSWSPPAPRVDNVRFTHDVHSAILEGVGDPTQPCEACHSQPGAGRMAVTGQVQLGTCFSCHAHEATEHQVDARCSTCHVPVIESGFDVERLAGLPVPSDHEPARFLREDHGRLAGTNPSRCATCHTSDRCVTCHVDTSRPEIAAIPRAPAGMELPPAGAHYFRPSTHYDDGWLSSHPSQASASECATCHTTEDCRACHVSPVPPVVATLPSRADVVAPGVHVARRGPDSHESLFFFEAHPTLAAGDGGACVTCHAEDFCVGCHDAPSGGGYHPPDFVASHPAEAFGREVECANCHNTQVFCRSCHVDSGLTGGSGSRPEFHDSRPLWLIRHGQSARQSLESCTTCHAQADCTRCHGTLGAFKVNPHSRDFDAERAWKRNPRPCFFCHVGNPIGSGP